MRIVWHFDVIKKANRVVNHLDNNDTGIDVDLEYLSKCTVKTLQEVRRRDIKI